MTGLHAGAGLPADPSARQVFMAESVRWYLERSGPGTSALGAWTLAGATMAPAFEWSAFHLGRRAELLAGDTGRSLWWAIKL